jgi:hypothetical protein
MTTFKDKLKLITSFKEELDKTSLPQAQIMYMEMISEDDEEYMREVKSRNRDLAIDILLDDKDESEWENRHILPERKDLDISSQYSSTNYQNGMGVISPKIMSMNVTGRKFISYEDVYSRVINFLEKQTQNAKTLYNAPSSALTFTTTNDTNKTDLENEEANSRRLITKLMMASNIIAQYGRIGPGKSVLVGTNVISKYPSLMNNVDENGMIGGMLFIVEPGIDPDKIIICRGNNIDQAGLILITYPNDGRFFLKETDFSWHRQYCWFTIK